MLTRSQTRNMDSTTVPTKSVRTNKQPVNQSSTVTTSALKSSNKSTTPLPTRYRTRLSTGALSLDDIHKKFLEQQQEFDEAFFEESSIAWNQNKKKIGNGMYVYRTRSRK